MRKFDWFISGAVAMLYSEIGNIYEAERGIADTYNPERDTTFGFVYILNGDLFINWPFIFSLIGVICFLMALVKLGKEGVEKREPDQVDLKDKE